MPGQRRQVEIRCEPEQWASDRRGYGGSGGANLVQIHRHALAQLHPRVREGSADHCQLRPFTLPRGKVTLVAKSNTNRLCTEWGYSHDSNFVLVSYNVSVGLYPTS